MDALIQMPATAHVVIILMGVPMMSLIVMTEICVQLIPVIPKLKKIPTHVFMLTLTVMTVMHVRLTFATPTKGVSTLMLPVTIRMPVMKPLVTLI
jgi:hypothetical protein